MCLSTAFTIRRCICDTYQTIEFLTIETKGIHQNSYSDSIRTITPGRKSSQFPKMSFLIENDKR